MREQIWILLCDNKYRTYTLELMISRYQKFYKYSKIGLLLLQSIGVLTMFFKQIEIGFIIYVISTFLYHVLLPELMVYVKKFNEVYKESQKIDLEIETLFNNAEKMESIDIAVSIVKQRINNTFYFNFDEIFNVGQSIKDNAQLKLNAFLKKNYNVENDSK